MTRTKQITALPIAAAFIGTVVGAGFATGQEILQFFTFYGLKGIIGIGIAAFLFFYFGFSIMRMAREQKADSHRDLVTYTAGPGIGIFLDWFITISFLGVLVVMAAGAGAVAEEQLNLPQLHGSLVIIILAFFTVISGIHNIIRAIGFVVPFLLIAVLGVAIYSILSDPLTGQKLAVLQALEPPLSSNWSLAAVLYVSYNLILAVAILSTLGVEARAKTDLLWGGILGAAGLGIGILAINLAIISNVPQVLAFQVPMAFLASHINPLFAYCYGFILLLEIYTTAVSILYGFVARISYRNNLKRFFWAAVASIGALLAARLGFARVIGTIYPVMGFIGLFFLASILWAQVREYIAGK
ncbi:MAG: hypothetical protein GX351_00970 [Peptococcaceae bacterium]|nr:hypothetical protein [Peptococcaceae bacterium]